MSAERRLLQETSARFIRDSWPLARVRRRADGVDEPVADERDYVLRSAELGWFAGLVDEAHGGGSASGQGVLDAVAVGQERGRALQPTGWVSANVAALALQRSGTPAQQASLLPGIAAGRLTAAWLPGASFGERHSALTATPTADGLRVRGTAVLDGERAPDVLVATCTTDDGSVVQALLPAGGPGVSTEPLSGLDLSRRFSLLCLEDVLVDDDAVLAAGPGAGAVREQLTLGALLASAEAVGTMEALLDMTVRYAKERTAFGRPIGSFQGLKHALADTAMRLECCRAVLAGAALDVQAGEPWADEVVSMLKSFTSDTAGALSQQCLQVHGGIGFTWEHDLHLYYRRLAVDETAWGSATWHRERICSLHSL